MAKKYLDYDGLLYFWQKIKNTFVPATRTVNGHALSSNVTITAADIGVESGAEANVQPDWDQTDTSADDYIKNKPTIPAGSVVDSSMSSTSENPVQNKVIYTALQGKVNTVSGKGLSTNDYTTTEKNKLAGIAAGAEVNVQADWNATSGDAMILHKPTIVNTDFTGATQSAAGTHGLVPAPNSFSQEDLLYPQALFSDGTWKDITNNVHYQLDDETLEDAYASLWNSIDGKQAKLASGTNIKTINNTSLLGSGNIKVCPLNASNKIDSSYLPSYVDDVIEVYARTGQAELSANWFSTDSASGSAITGEAGKIYILLNSTTNYAQYTQFRWSGSAYVKLADGGVSEITNAEIDTIVAS